MPDNDASRTTPKSPEELELEKQLALARLKNSIAQEQRGQYTAPNVTALQGNISSEGTFIESRILARRTLMDAFAMLGKNIAEKPGLAKPMDLILYNAADIPCIELYAGLRRQMEALDAHYTRISAHARSLMEPPASEEPPAQPVGRGAVTPGADTRVKGPVAVGSSIIGAAGALAAPGPALAGYAAGAVLRTAADLASLFRVDTDYKNFDLPIDDTALAAEFRKVIPAEWKVWHPAQFPVETVNNDEGSELLDLLERVGEKNIQALSLAATMNDKVRELTASRTTEPDARQRLLLQTRAESLQGALDGFTTVNTAFTQIQVLVTCVDNNSRTTTMSLLLRAERLLMLMKKKGAYVVKLAAVSRGSNKITKWIWSSAKIRHSAGTELNCLIFAPSGEVVFADTQLRYTPYRLPDELGDPL